MDVYWSWYGNLQGANVGRLLQTTRFFDDDRLSFVFHEFFAALNRHDPPVEWVPSGVLLEASNTAGIVKTRGLFAIVHLHLAMLRISIARLLRAALGEGYLVRLEAGRWVPTLQITISITAVVLEKIKGLQRSISCRKATCTAIVLPIVDQKFSRVI